METDSETPQLETHLNPLQQCLYPMITELLENYDNLLENEVTIKQDGASPHLDVRETMRWIDRRGPVDQPARSPDIMPLDFFQYGYLKSNVFTILSIQFLKNCDNELFGNTGC